MKFLGKFYLFCILFFSLFPFQVFATSHGGSYVGFFHTISVMSIFLMILVIIGILVKYFYKVPTTDEKVGQEEHVQAENFEELNVSAFSEVPTTISFCNKCGSKLYPNSDFCHKCGNKVALEFVYCYKCGKKNFMQDDLCSVCGKKLIKDEE